jgi:hypothetical protein
MRGAAFLSPVLTGVAVLGDCGVDDGDAGTGAASSATAAPRY